MYTAFGGGEVEAIGEKQGFYETFTDIVVKNQQNSFLLTVDMLGMFFSVFSAPFFNYCE